MALNIGTPGEIPSCFNLLVTHIDSVGPFLRVSGQTNKNCAAILDQLLAAADSELRAGKGSLPAGIVVSPGSLCLAQYKDSAFHRARVLDCRDGLVSVLFIDYGNKDTISLSDLRALDQFSPQISKFPGLATEYILAEGANLHGQWDDNSLSSLQNGLCNREFPCTVVAKFARWITISIPYNAGKLVDYLINAKVCMPVTSGQQGALLNQLADCVPFVSTMRANLPPEVYVDHAMPFPNRGFPSNPAAAMRMQSFSPHNGNYAPVEAHVAPSATSAISQRLQAHRTAPRNPAHLRPLQRAQYPTGNSETPSPAPAPVQPAQPASPGGSPRKTTTYKSRLLEVNSEHKVCVSFARDGPELFAVQLANEAFRLKEMMSEINKMPHRSLSEPPMIGTVCLGRMSGDKTICRAIVMNICGSQCKLFFVDFGDTEIVSYYDIFDIPEQFVKPNVYALRFCLSGLSDIKKGPAVNEAFQQLVELKKVILRVVAPEGPPLIQYGELYIDGKSVLELLKEYSNENLELKMLETLPVGTTVSAMVSYVDSCQKFFIQLSDNMDMLNEVMEEVKAHCMATPSLVSVREGSPCCALFSDDGVWYRAQVVQARGERALVCYVDYGNEQEVDLSELRPITAKLLDLPAQAIKCALKGFEDKPLDQMQSNQLEMLALERTLRASVVGYLDPGTVVVTLVHEGVSPPIDIARKMAQLSRPLNPPREKQPREPPPPQPPAEEEEEPAGSPGSDVGERNRFRSDKFFREDRRRDDDTSRGGSFRQKDRAGGKPWEKNQDKDDDWNEGGNGSKGFRERDSFNKKEETWTDSHDRREKKDWGEKRERGDRNFGDRPPRRESKDWEKKDTWGDKRENQDREKRDTWGDKKENFPRKNFQDRGDRNVGEKNFGERNSGDRNFGDRNSGDRNYGDKNSGEKNYGEKRERSNFAPRERRDRSFDGNRSFGSNKSVPKELSNPVPLEVLFKNPEIEIGSQLEVSIAWFTSPDNFFAQITSHQATFTDMMNKIPQIYKGIRPYSGNIDVGSSVLARFPEDRVLYRATVMGVQPFGKYIVQYVDFGNKTLVESKDIWQLEQELTDLPRMAIQCSLVGVKPIDKDWVKNKEMDLCFNAPRYQCVFAEYSEDIYKVSLWNNGVSVAEILAEKGLASLEAQSSVTLKDEPIDLTIIPGQEIMCRVTHVESMDKFYVQLDLEKAETVENIISTLDRSNLQALPAETIADGTHCVLLHEDRLFRAILEDVSNQNEIKAQLPDFGYSVHVPSTSLYNLPTELSTYYYQSLMCQFNNYTESSTQLVSQEELVARLKGNKFIMYINYVRDNTIISTLYDPNGDKVCLFEPDEGAFPAVSPLCSRAVYNYNFGTAYLTHAESLDQLYLQKASDEAKIADLLEKLFKFYEEGTPENLESYEEGGLCAGKSCDGNWYRATIVQPGEDTISVQFVDYGNSEDLSKESVRKLDPIFYEPCCLAIVVSLGLTPIHDDAVTKLSEMLADKEVLVTLTIGDEGWLANLHLNGEDISLKLVNDKIAAPQVADTEAVAAMETQAVTATGTQAAGETTKVYIAHIDTPGQFWLQMAEKVDNIEEIQAELQEKSASYSELETKEMGTLCVAKYSADDMWYRAEVLDSDSDITTVRFIDYGNTDVLDNVPGLLKEMPEHLRSIEKFAIKSSVNAVPTGTGQWSEPASDYFTELVGDMSAPVDALIVLKDVTTYVDLFVNGENLTDKLVAEKHATRSEETECGDLASCFASHINTPSEFWIQLESSTADLQAMETALADCENFPELTSKEEGTLCAAKYPEDGCWYRAQIIVEGSEGIEVLFMDYGNASIATELRSLPEELKLKPALSRKCALQKPRDIKLWSRKSEQKFNEMAAEGATIFNVQFIASGDISIVELFLEGKSVTEELAALCETPPTSERLAPVGQELLSNGFISQVNSPSDFYFKAENPNDTMAEKLESAEAFEEASEVKVGSIVAAKWDEDELWYRAKVIELCDVGAHVLFLDYGNKSKCDKFRQLPDDIASMELLATHCALVGFQENEVDKRLTQAFQDLAKDENVFQIEFLDTTKDPKIVRLLLNCEDVSELIKKKESQTVNDVGPEEIVTGAVKEEVLSETVNSKSPAKTDGLVHSESPAEAEKQSESPAESDNFVNSESPAKTDGLLNSESPAKSDGFVNSESPAETDGLVHSESPAEADCQENPKNAVESVIPEKPESPIKTENTVKSNSPVELPSSVKSESPNQSGETEALDISALDESIDANITVIENAEDVSNVKLHEDEVNENEEFTTPQSTPKDNSVKSGLNESFEEPDSPGNLNESFTNSKSDADEKSENVNDADTSNEDIKDESLEEKSLVFGEKDQKKEVKPDDEKK